MGDAKAGESKSRIFKGFFCKPGYLTAGPVYLPMIIFTNHIYKVTGCSPFSVNDYQKNILVTCLQTCTVVPFKDGIKKNIISNVMLNAWHIIVLRLSLTDKDMADLSMYYAGDLSLVPVYQAWKTNNNKTPIFDGVIKNIKTVSEFYNEIKTFASIGIRSFSYGNNVKGCGGVYDVMTGNDALKQLRNDLKLP